MTALQEEQRHLAVAREDVLDRWLMRAIRLTAVMLLLALAGLAGSWFLQRYVHANVSLLDRDSQLLEEQIRQQPNDPDLRVALANLYLEKGRYDDALSQGEQVLQVSRDNLGALLVLGQAQARKGNLDQAAAYLSRVLDLNKDNPMAKSSLELAMAHQALGSIYMQQGRAKDAEAEYQRSLEIDRTNADTLHLIGTAQSAQGKLDEAIQSYQQAVRLVPDFKECYQDLFEAYQQKGDWDRAAFARGMLAYTAGQYDQALEDLQQAVQALPNAAEVRLGLAMAYEKKGQKDQALEEYRRAVSLDSGSIAAKQGAARLSGQ